jgi:hypothetical protein
MKANVGGIDRILRVLIGLGLLAFLFLGEGAARWWGAIGVIPLVTALAGFCPIYTLLGLNTCPLTPGKAKG